MNLNILEVFEEGAPDSFDKIIGVQFKLNLTAMANRGTTVDTIMDIIGPEIHRAIQRKIIQEAGKVEQK